MQPSGEQTRQVIRYGTRSWGGRPSLGWAGLGGVEVWREGRGEELEEAGEFLKMRGTGRYG